jgi:hypothetical protein
MKDGYQSLVVWQKAMELAQEVYLVADMLPDKERYALAGVGTQLLLVNRLYPRVKIEKAIAYTPDIGRILYALIRKLG